MTIRAPQLSIRIPPPPISAEDIRRLIALSKLDMRDISYRYGLSEAELWNIRAAAERGAA